MVGVDATWEEVDEGWTRAMESLYELDDMLRGRTRLGEPEAMARTAVHEIDHGFLAHAIEVTDMDPLGDYVIGYPGSVRDAFVAWSLGSGGIVRNARLRIMELGLFDTWLMYDSVRVIFPGE
jgi:hypothetical protein